MIIINLYGGLDGLYAFPMYSGAQLQLLNSQYRPSVAVDPASILTQAGQTGVPAQIGFHPAFAPLVTVARNNIKIVQGYGIPGDPGRSHDTSQILMSLGTSRASSGDSVGFMARLMDHLDWKSSQFWAFSNENPSDTNTRKNPPVQVSDLTSLTYGKVGWESDAEAAFAANLSREIVDAQLVSTSLGLKEIEARRTMHETVLQVQSSISSQVVGNNSAGNYSDSTFGQSVRDAAKVLKAKGLSNDAGRDSLTLLGTGGFDTHSDQNNPQAPDGDLASLLGDLSKNLAVLYRDLEVMGALDKTVVILYSEFGRTVRQNGLAGGGSVGTDHGHASNTMVFGGPVSAGVIGEAPSLAELQDEEYNALLPKVDYRDIFADTLNWLGVDPQSIFDEPGYNWRRLGLIS